MIIQFNNYPIFKILIFLLKYWQHVELIIQVIRIISFRYFSNLRAVQRFVGN